MTLSEAIRSLIEAKGLSILTSSMALNILNDYNAFKEYPSSKNILKNVISEGIFDRIAFFYENHLPIGDRPQTYLSELYNKLGFRQDVSAYVLNSILVALGLGHLEVSGTIVETETTSNVSIQNPTTPAQSSSISTNITSHSGNHLEFKGLPINGSKNMVIDALIRQGYQFIDGGEDGALLKGKFAGTDDCQILVQSSPYTRQTYSISVFMPEALTWWSIKADYNRMKEMLQKKYGRPTSQSESFTSPYEEGDGYELTALRTGNVIYFTGYSSICGSIIVHITQNAQILLVYKDKINAEEHEQKEKRAAENDI